MKNLVIKISTWAFLAGLLFTGFGLWDIYEEKDVEQNEVVGGLVCVRPYRCKCKCEV